VFIISGQKVVRKKLGWVGDFCPICREIRPFRLISSRKVTHLYYIPVSRGEEVFTRTCLACAAVLDAAREAYAGTARRLPGDIIELVQQSMPDIDTRYADRFEMEDRLLAGELTGEDRDDAIMEPFALVVPQIKQRASPVCIDPVSGLCLAATAVVFAGGLIAAASVPPSMQNSALSIAFAAGGAGFLAFLILLATDVRRYVRRKLQPMLVRALAPLRPTLDELRDAIEAVRIYDRKIARKFDAARIHRAIKEREEAANPTPA
jgi:hypothetical protein